MEGLSLAAMELLLELAELPLAQVSYTMLMRGSAKVARELINEGWLVNMWGLIVGRPGVMKSPPVKAALKPKLVPILALIHHLASDGVGPVGLVSVLSALSWAEFLESHAHRIYGESLNCAVDGAKTILRHIRAGDLQSGFFARDIQRRAWANLGDDKDRVKDALDLEDHGWLRTLKPETGQRGGNPGVRYIINPKAIDR